MNIFYYLKNKNCIISANVIKIDFFRGAWGDVLMVKVLVMKCEDQSLGHIHQNLRKCQVGVWAHVCTFNLRRKRRGGVILFLISATSEFD